MRLAPFPFPNSSDRTCPTLPPFASCLIALLIAGSAQSVIAQASPETSAGDKCVKQEITLRRLQPTIWLVVDGSGSMSDPLSQSDSTPRWNALRSALLDPQTGVVDQLQQDVKWAMVMYDGPLPDGSADRTTACPRLVTVDPKLDNLSAIDAVYPENPLGGSTPTDKALAAVLARIAAQPAGADPHAGPNIVVLATDGAPNDFCQTATPAGDVRAQVIDAVKQLDAMGTRSYVVSLAGEDAELAQHLQQVAAAGGAGKPPFVPQDAAELLQSFQDIAGPGVQCEIALSSAVDKGQACMARVRLNGVSLPCNRRNGYRLKSPQTLELRGRACETYKHDPSVVLQAELPCEP
jgi:hypothetical protein